MIQHRELARGFSATLAAVFMVSSPVRGDPATPAPIEAFGQIPAVTDVDINPSGTRLAWIDNSGKLARIVIFDLASNREMRSMSMPVENTPRVVYWANDETLLASVWTTHSTSGADRHQKEWQRWFAIDAGGGPPRVMLAKGGGFIEWASGSSLVRRQTAKPGKIFLSSWDYSATKGRSETGTRVHRGRLDSSITYNLFEVDLKTGDADTLERGNPFTYDWITDPAAKMSVRADWDPTREKFSVHAKEGAGWKRLYEAGRCGRLRGLHFNAENTAVIARGSLCGENRVKLWSLPMDGTAMQVLVEDPARDVESVLTDPVDDSVIAAVLAGDEDNYRWLDPRAEKRRGSLRRSFGADWVSIYGRSTDGQRIVVQAQFASRPPVFNFVDFGAKRADIINEAYPQLTNAKFGSVRAFSYEARDKYPLVAYLTVPADTAEKDLPLVVLPHGGPESRDDLEFDWWAQFLASRGYAVIQPQFRGSSGFGQAHADAGRRQWGLRMQDDVTDAVSALVAQGIANPKRVCIVGASYGGYAALAGAAFTPDVYACAASISGVSDLPLFIGHVDRLASSDESSTLDYWREHIGPVSDPRVSARSPARAAAGVRAPILLIHGTQDSVVPIEQSRVMALALKEAGKPYQLVELSGEDHWMSQSTTRIRMLTELDKFLAKHLAPAGTAD
jgi:dienelactone hydrolase